MSIKSGKVNLNIGKYMKDKGISTYRVVKETELGYQTIKNYREGNLTRIDLDVLAKICTVLNIKSINEIIEYKGK